MKYSTTIVLSFTLLALTGLSKAWAYNPVNVHAGYQWRWQDTQKFTVSGLDFSVYKFRVNASAVDVAKQLVHGQGSNFDKLRITAEGLVLSGLWQDQHWLARLASSGDVTLGTISAMRLQPRSMAFDPARFAPPDAKAMLLVSNRPGKRNKVLAVYRCNGQTRQVLDVVSLALQRSDWVLQTNAAVPKDGYNWLHPNTKAKLSLTVRQIGGFVSLTFWYRDAEL